MDQNEENDDQIYEYDYGDEEIDSPLPAINGQKQIKNYDELMRDIVKYIQIQQEKLCLDDDKQIDNCLNLMIYYKWSNDNLLRSGFFDKDQVKIDLQGQGVINEYKIIQQLGECELCLENVNLYQIGCQHYFCLDCYQQYVIISLKNNAVPLMRCLKYRCNFKLPYQLIWLLNHDAKKYYQISLCKSFLQNNIKQACCLGGECDLILTRQESNQIDCQNCFTSMCVICKQYAHQPLNCDLAKKWQLKASNSDEQSNSLIKLKFQTCYNCKEAVERSQGCNHMKCRCGAHFCYICGEIWQGHENFYKCSKQTESEFKQQTEEYFNYFAIYESNQTLILKQIKTNKQIIKMIHEINKQPCNIKIQINNVKQLTELIILQQETVKYASLYEYYFIIDIPEKIETFNNHFKQYQQSIKQFTDLLDTLDQLLENFHIGIKQQDDLVEKLCNICKFVDQFPNLYSKGLQRRKEFLALISQ
ncbi:hypothetical protein pb186bvf_007132 [Paramecium bursaria]